MCSGGCWPWLLDNASGSGVHIGHRGKHLAATPSVLSAGRECGGVPAKRRLMKEGPDALIRFITDGETLTRGA